MPSLRSKQYIEHNVDDDKFANKPKRGIQGRVGGSNSQTDKDVQYSSPLSLEIQQ